MQRRFMQCFSQAQVPNCLPWSLFTLGAVLDSVLLCEHAVEVQKDSLGVHLFTERTFSEEQERSCGASRLSMLDKFLEDRENDFIFKFSHYFWNISFCHEFLESIYRQKNLNFRTLGTFSCHRLATSKILHFLFFKRFTFSHYKLTRSNSWYQNWLHYIRSLCAPNKILFLSTLVQIWIQHSENKRTFKYLSS